MIFKIVTRKEKEALKNYLACLLSMTEGCDPSDDTLEREWKELMRSVKGYLKKE